MGALDPGNKAPWPNSTPEEDKAYAQSVELGDTEFELEVADYMGPYGREYIDADKYNVTKDPEGMFTLAGMYYQYYNDVPSHQEYYDAIEKNADIKLERDNVYVFGTEFSTPRIAAHEFRHRKVETERYGGRGELLPEMHHEKRNRLWDVFRADDPASFAEGFDAWAGWMYEEKGKAHPKSEVYADLLDHIDKYKEVLLNEEVMAGGPVDPADFDRLKQIQRKRMQARMARWKIE